MPCQGSRVRVEPKPFQRGFLAVGGPLGSAQATTVPHKANSSISQSTAPSGHAVLTSLEHAGTVKHRLSQSQPRTEPTQ